MTKANKILEALRHAASGIRQNVFDLTKDTAQTKEITKSIDGITFTFGMYYNPRLGDLNVGFVREGEKGGTVSQVTTAPITALRAFKFLRNLFIPVTDDLWRKGLLHSISFESKADEKTRVQFYKKAASEIAKRYNGHTLSPYPSGGYIVFEIILGKRNV